MHYDHPDLAQAVRLSNRLTVTQQFLRDLLAHSSQVKFRPMSTRDRLREFAIRNKGPPDQAGLATLIPDRGCITDILKRILNGKTVGDMIAAMKNRAGDYFNEFSDLSVDGTVNVVQSLVGSVPTGKSGATGDKCLTLKGRTGMVVGVGISHSESFEAHYGFFEESVPSDWRGTVQTIFTDHPPALLSKWSKLVQLFPSLKAICEDPAHLKIRLEKVSNEKDNQISKLVHPVAMQFFGLPRSRKAGEGYRFTSAEDATESRAGYAEGSGMSDAEAKQFHQSRGSLEVTAENFGKLLGSIAVIGADQLERKDKQGRTLGSLLEAQCDHYAYLRNGSLRLAELSEKERDEKAIGTASNEGLHREVGGLGACVWRQSHPLAAAKFRGFVLKKLSASFLRKHNTAAREQTAVMAGVAGYFSNMKAPIIVKGYTTATDLLEKCQQRAAGIREKIMAAPCS